MLPLKKAQNYCEASGKEPFKDWFDNLDADAAAKVHVRITRAEQGNFGDSSITKGTGGVRELVLDFGPGYRVYLGEDGNIIVLLIGGIKKSQQRDIKKAAEYWDDYKQRKDRKKEG